MQVTSARRVPVLPLFGALALLVASSMVVSGCASESQSPEGSPPEPSDVRPTGTPDPSAGRPRDFAQAIQELATAKGSGVIALVRSPEGSWSGASGQASDGRPAAPGDRFAIASTTKTFTATVVLQLVGEGRLSLDDSVERWLPGKVREGGRITIRHLLNHTSGIAQGQSSQLPPTDDQPPLLGEPGTTHRYSNTNYLILGLVIEALTGTSLDGEVRDRIFDPLGLDDSSYGSVLPRTEPDRLPPFLGFPAGQSTGAIGSGGIVSTAADLATFFGALLAGDLLGGDQLLQMQRTVDATTDPLAGQAAAASRAGLGIFELELACDAAWGHGGDIPGYSNQVLASRDGSNVVVVAQNTMGWPAANATAVEMYCL